MHPIRDRSIKTKLVLLSVVSVGLALLLACLGFTVHEFVTRRAAKQQELETHARMLAFSSTRVLRFGDAAAARQLLASLQSLPGIESACLRGRGGAVLATYPEEGMPPALSPGDDGCRFTADGYLESQHRVFDQGEPVGSLYLRANLEELRESLTNYGIIAAVVMLFSLASSVILAFHLQKGLSEPILHLARTAERISAEGDYSVRVEPKSGDELGTLYEEFNRMLQRVESSEKALRETHDELEQRVLERTAELREQIEHRERAQAELVRSRDAAQAANVAKSRFLANMSHEIRTPLNAILGFADLLRREAGACTREEREDYLETIHTSGKHLLGLINDILDLSKIEAERLEVEQVSCSPHQIISEIISVLRVKAIEKGLALEYRWLSVVPETIRTDPARFRQLLMNLVSNAVKFTRVGSVQVLAELQTAGAGPRLVVRVVDTGIGISQDKLQAIFDPFVQADNSVTREFGGTGLGLTISRRIAEALGGGVEVASEPGRGSTFAMTIATGPLEGIRMLASPPTDALRRAQTPSTQGPAPLPPARVLLAEDGDTNRKLIGLVLRRAGLDVTTAANGQIAVDLATRHPFELILMDMQMPVMDGYTAATRLRQAGLRTPIVALTAHAMKGDEEKCRAAGCSGYLTKPIDADLLVRTVASLLSAVQNGPPEPAPPASGREGRAPGGPLVSTLPTEDPDFREIVQEFAARLRGQLDAMARACAEKDSDELARLAHWLKGSGGTAGFPQFTEPARELEQASKRSDWQRSHSLLDDLVGLASRIVVEPAGSPG